MPARSAAAGVARYDRTKAAILDAAAHALSEHGGRTSMADVAAAAGVSRATLYRYYPDREALLGALASRALADAAARLADAGLERAPVEEAIERIVRALTTVGDRYAVLAREQVEDGVAVADGGDRKSTRLNSSHGYISYAVFCLKKKKKTQHEQRALRTYENNT